MDHPYYLSEPFTKMQAWIDMILLASHKEHSIFVRGQKVIISRGQIAMSEQNIAARWRWSRGKVRRYMNELEIEQQIEQQKNNVISLISIVNYSKYQSGSTTDDTTDSTSNGTASSTTDGTANGTQSRKRRREKNEKNEKKNIIDDMLSSAYKLSVDFWLKEFHVGWDFGSVHGKNLKTLLMKLKKSMEDSGREITSQTICDTFKAMCINLPDWFKDKDLPVLASKYNEIIQQIKDGKNRKPKGGADPTLTVESVWS